MSHKSCTQHQLKNRLSLILFFPSIFCLDNGQEVTISVPLLSIYEIKRFPKQYLENEKLAMLNDGIEIITSNFLSVKVTILSLPDD